MYSLRTVFHGCRLLGIKITWIYCIYSDIQYWIIYWKGPDPTFKLKNIWMIKNTSIGFLTIKRRWKLVCLILIESPKNLFPPDDLKRQMHKSGLIGPRIRSKKIRTWNTYLLITVRSWARTSGASSVWLVVRRNKSGREKGGQYFF